MVIGLVGYRILDEKEYCVLDLNELIQSTPNTVACIKDYYHSMLSIVQLSLYSVDEANIYMVLCYCDILVPKGR